MCLWLSAAVSKTGDTFWPWVPAKLLLHSFWTIWCHSVSSLAPVLSCCTTLRQSTSPSFMTKGSPLDTESYCQTWGLGSESSWSPARRSLLPCRVNFSSCWDRRSMWGLLGLRIAGYRAEPQAAVLVAQSGVTLCGAGKAVEHCSCVAGAGRKAAKRQRALRGASLTSRCEGTSAAEQKAQGICPEVLG